MNKIKTTEMNNEENNKKDSNAELGKIGDQNIEAKTTYMAKKKAIKVTSASPLSPQDKMILNDVKNGRDMNLICAQYMVNKHYVAKLVETNK